MRVQEDPSRLEAGGRRVPPILVFSMALDVAIVAVIVFVLQVIAVRNPPRQNVPTYPSFLSSFVFRASILFMRGPCGPRECES